MAELKDTYQSKRLVQLLTLLLWAGAAFAQNEETDPCKFDPANNGKRLTVQGRVDRRMHDMLLVVPNCKETAILTYAGRLKALYGISSTSPSLPRQTRVEDDANLSLRVDRNFRRLDRYVNASYKSSRRHSRSESWKYEVEAVFTGRLDVTEGAGLVRDDTNQNIIGIDGFGHPIPFTRYRFVMESVSDVRVRSLSKAKLQ